MWKIQPALLLLNGARAETQVPVECSLSINFARQLYVCHTFAHLFPDTSRPFKILQVIYICQELGVNSRHVINGIQCPRAYNTIIVCLTTIKGNLSDLPISIRCIVPELVLDCADDSHEWN